MKLALEVLVSLILHPVAMILMWINVLARRDLNALAKVAWLVTSILWGLGPILYVAVGGGALW